MSSKLFSQWQPTISDAIADVRSDNTTTDYVLVGYSGNKVETLEYISSGEGGVDALKSHLKDDQAMYGLVRVSERIDESDTIKFCFIKWVGTDMRPMNRAKLTPQVGDITAKFKPYHVDVYCTEMNEVSQEIVEGLVGKASMAKSAVIDNQKAKVIMDDNERKRRAVEDRKTTTTTTTATSTTTPSTPSSSSSSSSNATTSLSDDQKQLLERLEGFRLSGVLTDEEFELKKKQIISESTTTTTTTTTNATTTTTTTRPTPTPTTPTTPTTRSPTTTSSSSSSSVSSSGSRNDVLSAMERAVLVRFPNPDTIIDALRQLRNDDSDIDWLLTGYTDLRQTKDMTIDLIGYGNGGVEELKQHLKDDGIYYGLVRLTDRIDNSITVKFAFLQFLGQDLKPMARARVTTHKLTVSEVFQPYHVETFANQSSELSQELLQELVGSASFSKSNVINNDRARQIMEENETKRRNLEDKNNIVL